jgi:peptide alpha-N-acetyltransferase
MTEAEKKKARNKARKAELKANKENQDPATASSTTAAASTTASSTSTTSATATDDKDQDNKEEPKKDGKKNVDQDPEGDSYLKTQHPVDDAFQLVEPLLRLSPGNVDTQLLAFDIYLRQEKWLLAIKALNTVSQLKKNHPELKSKIESCKSARKFFFFLSYQIAV